ncbi:MAG: maltose ABC transporter permease MalF [Burkholderiales bacterium PBB3]|nr:MAG: maltose ABC transporter permease MalF [Burkholderiales bacterium PBB3]
MRAGQTPAWFKWPLACVLALGALYAVMVVHATGQTLLAVTLLGISGLALWTYTSSKTHALRYLLPGVAAALIFVIFPMLYTFGIGFTNQSSRNLLAQEQAYAHLLAESLEKPGSRREFQLQATDSSWRLTLLDATGAPEWITPALQLIDTDKTPQVVRLSAATSASNRPAPLPEVVHHIPVLRKIQLQRPDGSLLQLSGIRTFAEFEPLYVAETHAALRDTLTRTVYSPDPQTGFFTSAQGDQLQPGYRVNVGLRHFLRVFTDDKFRQPFQSVFGWTVVFAALSVFFAAALGLLLAVLLKWDSLECKGAYRLVLFLPYAVPGFISILVFKGLFNQNLGEINLILHGLFGVKPAWFSDPLLAKTMLLIVNVWLGFPYMMVLCSGLVSSIPQDIYEAAAVAGSGPWTTFRRLTLPLILKPLTPLLIAAFAFNFNNFVLISLLTDGRPDILNTKLPAGTTDILVSYTYRIAFTDAGANFGLAAAISTVIFFLVAILSLLNLKMTQSNDQRKG